MPPKLLIIEDEPSLAKQMKWGLSDIYQVCTANNADKAKTLLTSGAFPVATLDLGLPPFPNNPEQGFKLLESANEISPHTRIIVITGNDEQENAVKAIGLGAADFCSKPLDLEVLKIILKRNFRICELEAANRKLQEEYQCSRSLYGMIGISPVMTGLFAQIRKASETDYPVLIQGETGTGKEMAARAVFNLSRRSQESLIIINCGAIPENLLESELFGHEKGAFTGADSRKTGKFELADKGTLFLDEIGDMPHTLQVKLLRFIQEGTIERVGGSRVIKLDVRIIAATHVNLEQAVKEKRFREDLFYRLNVIPIIIPPLRERLEDILVLANHFIRKETEKIQRDGLSLSPAAAAALTSHSWPGNVRELQNCIFRALTKADQGIISLADLGLSNTLENIEPLNLSIKAARDNAELRVISQAMAVTDNNISQAAKLLGVSRPTLHDLLKKHEIITNK
ncbi:PEP-CTERM-box response regulator transcription factor [Desulfonema limicola]|uniref:PEP-CTERM-box response regulator transcription factor n=1 Tax=Desulfonema limicola TaxID=45656 RepID=A0A975B9F8_9BACT|nr:PEP-CTERM-box response regulator transcription factor [Desulfonema limicola]QTA81126.1 PEP-CTERM-box response regulator transcription factor [Desulfonema limicola]